MRADKISTIAAVAVAYFAVTISAIGAPVDDAREFEHVIVTATRNSVLAIEAPAAIHTFTADDLRMRQQTRSTPETLGSIPGVMIQRTAHGQGSPYIRGFTGFRTLFLIDGIRLNNSTYRDGPNQYWNTVDPFSIGELELVKGPVSVLYGSDAIGGTVNAITPNASDLSDGALYAGLLYRYSSAENSRAGRVEVAQVFDNGIGIHAGYSGKDFGNLDSAIGSQAHTGYPERDVDFKLSMSKAQEDWTFAYQRVAIDDAWRTHKTIFAQGFAGTEVGNELRRSLNQRRELTYLRYRRDEPGPFDELVVTASYQQQDEDRLRIRSGDRTDHQGTLVDTTGLSLDAGLDAVGHWQFGAEWYRDDVDSFRRDFNPDGSLRQERIQGPVGDDSSYRTIGLYAQNQFTTGAVTWTAGARYTHAKAQADKVEDVQTGEQISIGDSWSAVTGSVRAVWRPGESDWRLFGGVSQGFRAPNLSDLSRLDTARSDEIEVPSAGLEPEDFLNYELGLRIERAQGGAQLSVFHTEIDDLVTRTPTGRVIDGENEVIKINSGDGNVRGFEAEGHLALPGELELFGTFTWIDGEVLTFPTSEPVAVTEPLDRLMPITTTGGLRWQPRHGRYWAEFDLVRAERADELSTRDANDTQRIPPGGTPGYTVMGLRGGWTVNRGLSIAVALENVADEPYRIHGSGVNEAGRNIVMTLNWQPGAR